ncbi:MAG: dihydroxyacetone kinase subunit L [Actinobacteria bacterium RBG_19FT_COMBO_36_27]|nr:MAG: dihydroxyacetone kinase subunit L [Actinobacteria bacterium RBG_19FT_COMBO_36_27]
MQYFLNSNGVVIIYDLIKTIQDNALRLSEIDGAIGDGDHGINMNKGFTLCKERLIGEQINLSTALNVLSETLLNEIGGAMGPLYGMFFFGMSNACNNKKQIDSIVFKDMLETAVSELSEIDLSKAKIGDKTMMDTLIPAVEAYKTAINNRKNFIEALEEMKIAAEKGKESTKELIAKVGRASRLGERSKGFLDVGAVSSWLILKSMADSIIQIIINN